jgi:hypothetical protein
VAWEATLRGLAVALVDKADFGSATSANGLRIIHGRFAVSAAAPPYKQPVQWCSRAYEVDGGKRNGTCPV